MIYQVARARVGGADMPDALQTDLGEYFMKWQPLKQVGYPLDIANAVLWLVSDESRFVTGHPLVVDGGMSVGLARNTILKLADEFGEIYQKYY
jgi:NAD(P)-dependent dehydrogenase (short-subunit alcohol dehydrogenase family)